MERFGLTLVLVAALAVADASTGWFGSSAHAMQQGDNLPPLCFGDCNGDGRVVVSEVILLVNTALGNTPVSACPGLAEPPAIHELVRAVNNLLFQCPSVVTYRLGEPSTIIVSQGPTAPPPTPKPLSGQFTVIASSPLPPNTLFGFTIMRINLSGAGLSITEGDLMPFGCSLESGFGCINATTIQPTAVSMSALVTIDNQSFLLDGAGPFGGDAMLPALGDVQLCGRAMPPLPVSCDDIRAGVEPGYLLTIFAEPVKPSRGNQPAFLGTRLH